MEGPKTSHPTKYIRYIYNRVVLENAVVRAAAVSSLAKFGVCVNDSKVMKSVHVLLRRCLEDVDDEVRDRAAMYIKVLDEQSLADAFVREGQLTFRVSCCLAKLTPTFRGDILPGDPRIRTGQLRQRRCPSYLCI